MVDSRVLGLHVRRIGRGKLYGINSENQVERYIYKAMDQDSIA